MMCWQAVGTKPTCFPFTEWSLFTTRDALTSQNIEHFFFYMLSSNSFLTYRAGNVRLLGKLKAISICASCPWPALHQLLQPLEQTTIPQHLRRTDLKFQMTVVYWRCHKAKAVYCNRWTVCGPCISVLDGNDWSNILCLILPSRTFLLD